MAGPTSESMSLLARLELLDSRLRQLRRIGIYALIFVVIALVLLMIGLMRSRGGAGESREFYLKDENGKPRAWLGIVQGEPGLEFYNANGKTIAGFKITEQEAGLLFLDENKKVRARFGLTQGGPSLVLYDGNGKPQVVLNNLNDQRALLLLDDNNKPRAGFSVDKQGPHLILDVPKAKKPSAKP